MDKYKSVVLMPTESIEVQVRAVLPCAEGCAVFLGTEKKVVVIHIDPSIGQSIAIALSATRKERPLTHDLMANTLTGFGIKLERMVINDAVGGTFYARIILRMENELGVKIVEVDARPSDAIVLCLNARKPLAIAADLWARLEDATALMQKLLKEKN